MIAQDTAIKYRCPRKVGISLKGISHNLDQSERTPRSCWSTKEVMAAMDKLTAALLVLKVECDWARAATGHRHLEVEGVKILPKMDTCAVKIIKETMKLIEASPTPTDFQQVDGIFGINDALDQLKRLMTKDKGVSEFAADCNSPEIFSKALRLVQTT